MSFSRSCSCWLSPAYVFPDHSCHVMQFMTPFYLDLTVLSDLKTKLEILTEFSYQIYMRERFWTANLKYVFRLKD